MISPAQLVTLTGKLGGTEEQVLTAIVGQEGVTPTDGWSKWAQVERRQRTAVTVLQGYAPYTITLPLLLDAQALGLADVEGLCSILEWFGGRGALFHGNPGKAGEGESPLITLFSTSALIPAWIQNRGEKGLDYVLQTPIEYNMLGREWIVPIRKGSGEPGAGRRVRQAANLTLVQYVEAPIGGGGADSAAARLNALDKQEHTYIRPDFTVTAAVDTFIKIAGRYNRTTPERISDAAQEIQQANSRYGASVHKKLPVGAKIRIPESATSKRVAG